MSYYLDPNDQARFGMQEPDDEPEPLYPPEDYPEPEQCDKCMAWGHDASDHTRDCPYFEEQELPL